MLPPVSLSGSALAQGVTHGQVLRRAICRDLSPYFQRFALGIGLFEVLRRAALYQRALQAVCGSTPA